MTNVDKLKGKIKEMRLTPEKVADAIGIDKSTMYRKLNNGGDEFTIITLGITEDELNSKVAAIKKVAESYDNVSFAIGSCYESDKSNVRLALRLADERMYEDKRLYYKEHPEFERV